MWNAVNNLCGSLIVYGTYAPGGPNHHIFSRLPGVWRKGMILASLPAPPDGIGCEEDQEDQEVEAWVIEFSSSWSVVGTPEWDQEKRALYDQWMALDEAMGEDWARDTLRWWPEGSQPSSTEGMIVVNAYLPLKYFPRLRVRYDAPSPDESEDQFLMWNQVKTGERCYE